MGDGRWERISNNECPMPNIQVGKKGRKRNSFNHVGHVESVEGKTVGIRIRREEVRLRWRLRVAMEKRGEYPITNNQCPISKW